MSATTLVSGLRSMAMSLPTGRPGIDVRECTCGGRATPFSGRLVTGGSHSIWVTGSGAGAQVVASPTRQTGPDLAGRFGGSGVDPAPDHDRFKSALLAERCLAAVQPLALTTCRCWPVR